MGICLGIDTSNYTTSAALYLSDNNKIIHLKKPLPVKTGERGIRQSDAVFHHVVQLPDLIENLFNENAVEIDAVGASDKPRNVEGSYMPCFLTGIGTAKSIAKTNNIPLYNFSHQEGHIAAALYSSDKLYLIGKTFLAFHVSGGTTEALLVEPDEKNIFKIKLLASSLDLKAGQAIDRVGVMLGLDFPAGAELEKLANKSKMIYKIKPVIKGIDCSLSGIENKCIKMKEDGEKEEDIALFCIEYIGCTIEKITEELIVEYKDLPIIYSGGVMSDTIIKNRLLNKFDAFFATPEFSSDNAAGIAILTSMKDNLK